jgi:hypothetical protein
VKLIYRPIQAGLANQSQLAEHICVGLIRTLHQFDAIGTPSNRPVHMAVFLPCLREATVLKSMLENQMSWALASKVDVVFAPDAGEPVAIEPSASKRACFTVHLCWNGRENGTFFVAEWREGRFSVKVFKRTLNFFFLFFHPFLFTLSAYTSFAYRDLLRCRLGFEMLAILRCIR